MVVEPVEGLSHPPVYLKELLVRIFAVLTSVILCLVLHIERLGHVQPIQPYLVGINFLMPEVSCGCAGLFLQLAVYSIHSSSVFFFSGQLVKIEQGFAGIYMIQVILLWVIGLNGAVLSHKAAGEGVRKVQVPVVSGYKEEFDDGLNHAAVNIVPGGI